MKVPPANTADIKACPVMLVGVTAHIWPCGLSRSCDLSCPLDGGDHAFSALGMCRGSCITLRFGKCCVVLHIL